MRILDFFGVCFSKFCLHNTHILILLNIMFTTYILFFTRTTKGTCIYTHTDGMCEGASKQFPDPKDSTASGPFPQFNWI